MRASIRMGSPMNARRSLCRRECARHMSVASGVDHNAAGHARSAWIHDPTDPVGRVPVRARSRTGTVVMFDRQTAAILVNMHK